MNQQGSVKWKKKTFCWEFLRKKAFNFNFNANLKLYICLDSLTSNKAENS